MLSMVTSAMFYDIAPSQSSAAGIAIGPFTLTPEQVNPFGQLSKVCTSRVQMLVMQASYCDCELITEFQCGFLLLRTSLGFKKLVQ